MSASWDYFAQNAQPQQQQQQGMNMGNMPIGSLLQAISGQTGNWMPSFSGMLGGGEGGGFLGGLFGGGAEAAGAGTAAGDLGTMGMGTTGMGSGAGGSSAMASMANPWTALAAVILGTSIGSLSKGHDNQGLNTWDNIGQMMGGSGWGGPPMQAFQDAFKGDFGSAAENALSSSGGTNLFAPLVNGGSWEDGLKNQIAPFLNLQDLGSGGNVFNDIIQNFASPFAVRKDLKK